MQHNGHRGLLRLSLMAVLFAYLPGVALGAPSMPATYHNGATLVCSDCHTMHFSQSHGFAGGSVGTTPALGGDWLPATGPNPSLLKAPSSAALCLACHDGQSFAPDVMGTADSSGNGENRAAGYFPALLDASTYKGHNLSGNPDANGPGWGSWDYCARCHGGMFGTSGTFATASVTCTDCHAKHGNGGYRNLQWASSPEGTPTIVALTKTGTTGMGRYDGRNIGYTSPQGDTSWREATNMCIDCHHTLSGSSYTTQSGTGSTPYMRHPVTESERSSYQPINKAGAHTDPSNWVNATNGFSIGRLPFIVRNATTFAEATTVAANNEAFCLSCHKAHGTANAFGLRWAYGGPQNGHNTDGCIQCHNNVLD